MGNSKIFYDSILKNASSYFDKLIYTTTGGTVFVDGTEASTFESPLTIPWSASSGEIIYACKYTTQFSAITLFHEVTTAPTFTNRVLEYWNGSAWTSLTHVKVDFSTLNRYDLPFVWDIPTDWAKTSVEGIYAYWIRFRNSGAASGALTIKAILQQTVVSTVAELAFSQENLINESITGATFRSRYESFEIITGQNDTIDYTEDGNTRSVTIPAGYYYPDEAIAQINAVTSAFSVTWDYDLGSEKFSTSKSDAGTYTLLWASGTNKAKSLGVTLGFDCSADDTGATSYTADNPSKTTGGRFTIDSTNKVFFFNDGTADRTVTLTEGAYNAKSLCTALKSGADTAATVTNIDWQFDEYIGYFKTKRASGTYILKFSHATSTIETTVGWDAVGDITTTAGSYSVGENSKIHTEVDVYFCMPERWRADQRRAVLARWNFLDFSGGPDSLIIQRLTTTSFTTTYDFSLLLVSTTPYVQDTSTDSTASSVWRLRIIQPGSGASFIELGYVFAEESAFDLGKKPMKVGNRYKNISFADKQTSPSGHMRGNARNIVKARTFTFDNINTVAQGNLDSLEEVVQDVGVFWFVIDEADLANLEMMLCRFADLPSAIKSRAVGNEVYNTILELIEAI